MTLLGNLLNQAFSAIPKQSFSYYAFTGRTTNDVGYDIATYASPLTVFGSVQAIPREKYEFMGLDFQKKYINIYISKEIIDIDRDVSGDQFFVLGRRFQALSKTWWFNIDGWVAVLCVEVSDA